MATRCQVQVVDEKNAEDKVTLYHHWDGYPENMIPLITKAYDEYAKGWEGGRVGKVASMLCAVDPMQFEPEAGHDLHGDIEFLYKVIVKNPEGMHVGSKPSWDVETWVVSFDFEGEMSDEERLGIKNVVHLKPGDIHMDTTDEE